MKKWQDAYEPQKTKNLGPRHKHLDPIDYTVHVEEQSLDLKDFIRNEPILDENSKAKPWSRKKFIIQNHFLTMYFVFIHSYFKHSALTRIQMSFWFNRWSLCHGLLQIHCVRVVALGTMNSTLNKITQGDVSAVYIRSFDIFSCFK